MRTTVNLPDSLYRKSEVLAASRGATVEQFIVEAVKKEVQGNLRSVASSAQGDREVELPVIRSMRPGTLDLSHFDFDDLLACRQRLDCPSRGTARPSSRSTTVVQQSSKRRARVLPRYPVGLSSVVDEQARHARSE